MNYEAEKEATQGKIVLYRHLFSFMSNVTKLKKNLKMSLNLKKILKNVTELKKT